MQSTKSMLINKDGTTATSTGPLAKSRQTYFPCLVMRQALLGVFLGFVLIDLVFDLDSLDGNFEAPTSFYQHRNHTIPSVRMTILLQIPLGLVVLTQLFYAVKHRTWASTLSFICTLAANMGGARVMTVRAAMDDSNPLLLHEQLIQIAWLHIVMFPIIIVAMITAREQPQVRKSKKLQ